MRAFLHPPVPVVGLLLAAFLLAGAWGIAQAQSSAQSPAAAQQGFPDGLTAFNAGDFAKAAHIWQPLAEGGDANAENGMGLLYYAGFGVDRDYENARTMFLNAAQQGVVQAQMFLGLMYYKGDGVRRDDKTAFMWSDIAVGEGFSQAADFRAMVAETLSPEDQAEALKLASDWRAYYAQR